MARRSTPPSAKAAPDYSYARRPLWIVSHVAVVLGIVALISLGFWQVARYRLHDDLRARILEQTRAEPEPVESLVRTGDEAAVGERLEYRRVRLEGTYLIDQEVSIRNRSFDGAPGRWVLTPLRLDSGVIVPVVRGWIPVDPQAGTDAADRPPFDMAAPVDPAARHVVSGIIRPTQSKGTFGATDPAEGRLNELSRVDVPRFVAQLEGVTAGVLPVWVQLDAQAPPQAERFPRPVETELPDPSQNMSYVVQWFIFASIATVGYVLILRRQARHQGARTEVPLEATAGTP